MGRGGGGGGGGRRGRVEGTGSRGAVWWKGGRFYHVRVLVVVASLLSDGDYLDRAGTLHISECHNVCVCVGQCVCVCGTIISKSHTVTLLYTMYYVEKGIRYNYTLRSTSLYNISLL